MALATKGLIATELSCPEVVHFFGPRPEQEKHTTYPKRQKVRGKLRLVMSKPIKFNRIEIRFKGHSQLTWRNPLKSHNALLVEKMHAWKTLRKWRTTLVENATLPAGVTELGFEVTLPGHLCASFKSPFLEIQYMLMAFILPSAKFAKEIHVSQEIRILKTLVPKDVVYGRVPGFKVPRVSMRGERPVSLAWEFQVPRWVCLENGYIEFDGILRRPTTVSEESAMVTVEKIEVDVVQEEFYRGDLNDPRCMKRHLVICMNTPSTYIQPPLETPIPFAFPLETVSTCSILPSNGRHQLRRVHSVPTHLSDHASLAPLSIKKIVAPTGDVTTLSRGHLTYSLKSPFLKIQHFIRIVIYLSNNGTASAPICIGLPIPITKRIELKEDSLPTYETSIREGEELPDYFTASSTAGTEEDDERDVEVMGEEEEDGESTTINGTPLPPLPRPRPRPSISASSASSLSEQQHNTRGRGISTSRSTLLSPRIEPRPSYSGIVPPLLSSTPPTTRRRSGHQHSSSQPPSLSIFNNRQQQQTNMSNSITNSWRSTRTSSNFSPTRSNNSSRSNDITIEERTLDGFYIQPEFSK